MDGVLKMKMPSSPGGSEWSALGAPKPGSCAACPGEQVTSAFLHETTTNADSARRDGALAFARALTAARIAFAAFPKSARARRTADAGCFGSAPAAVPWCEHRVRHT